MQIMSHSFKFSGVILLIAINVQLGRVVKGHTGEDKQTSESFDLSTSTCELASLKPCSKRKASLNVKTQRK